MFDWNRSRGGTPSPPAGDTKPGADGDAFVNGALLLKVLTGSPAALAGLLPGDKIIALDGQLIHSSNDLTDRLDRLPSRTMIHLEVVRGRGVDSQRLAMELRTSSRPEAATGKPVVPLLHQAASQVWQQQRQLPQA